MTLANEQVTFRYGDNKGKRHSFTLPVEEFMRCFLQNVLPKGFKKVRYYGLFSPAKRNLLHRVRRLLLIQPATRAAVSDEPQAQDWPLLPPGNLPGPTCGRPMPRLTKLEQIWYRPP